MANLSKQQEYLLSRLPRWYDVVHPSVEAHWKALAESDKPAKDIQNG
jgi:hypothetical protein